MTNISAIIAEIALLPHIQLDPLHVFCFLGHHQWNPVKEYSYEYDVMYI